jgi:hypothetical protein
MYSFLIQRKYSITKNLNQKKMCYYRSSTKFSRHLIFQTKDPFLDNLAVGKFVNLVLEDIHGCLLNHQCSAVLNASPFLTQSNSDSVVFAKNLLATIESHLFRFEQCECIDEDSQLCFKDIIEFIVKKNDGSGLTWFCDMGINTFDFYWVRRICLFRCLYKKSCISITSIK